MALIKKAGTLYRDYLIRISVFYAISPHYVTDSQPVVKKISRYQILVFFQLYCKSPLAKHKIFLQQRKQNSVYNGLSENG